MTKSHWQVAADELFALRGHGGQNFAEFVSALLRAEGSISRLRIDDIRTNVKASVADGGVDAEVAAPLHGSLCLKTPSCWQFKATAFSEVNVRTLQREANKSEAKRLIQAGHAYCLCVCDDAPPPRIAALEGALRIAVREINSDAAEPRILSAGQLAEWASRHSGIVVRFFRQDLGNVLAYDAWLRKERADLPQFVEFASRAGVADRLRNHVVGGVRVSARAVLTLAGPPGAGISRLVAETLSIAASRIVYVPEAPSAVGIVTSLVNQPDATAVLVVNRCRSEVRREVEGLLKAESSRFRVVAIHDPAERAADGTIKLAKLEDTEVQKIIDANFSSIPWRHRRAFVKFADGIPRIAAALTVCYGDDPSKFLVDATSWAQEELLHLVPDPEDVRVLKLLSLFTRVGYSGRRSNQLNVVCNEFGLDSGDVVRRASRLAVAPGVIERGPRFLSVRPTLFAKAVFEAAWSEMIGSDGSAVLKRLPSDLMASFLKQAALYAHKQARETLADWAMTSARDLKPADLGSARILGWLLPMVDVSPARIGTLLADLVAQANDDEAAAPGETVEHWPARLNIIWKLERLLGRAETYTFAEAALFRLARAELLSDNAARDTSSAAAKWGASYRLYLSGTEVAFEKRLGVLTAKLDCPDEKTLPLVILAVDFTLDKHAWSAEGSPILGGEVRPADWRPETSAQASECLSGATRLLGRCMSNPLHRASAFQVLVNHGRGLLQGGLLGVVQEVLEILPIDERQRVAVRGFVGDFLAYDVKGSRGNGDRYPPEYVESVVAWYERLKGRDLSGQILEALSFAASRDEVHDEQGWTARLDELGAAVCAQPTVLRQLLPLLVEGEHHDGALSRLGRAVGLLDSAAVLLPMVFSAVTGERNPIFIRGYVAGLAEQGESGDSGLREELHRLETTFPELAVDFNQMNLRIGSPAARALRLVREGRLPAESLGRVWSIGHEGELLADALEVVLDAMGDRPEDAAACALKLMGSLAWKRERPFPHDERTLSAIWRALELSAQVARSQGHTWVQLLRRSSERDFERAVRLACKAAGKGDSSVRDEAIGEVTRFIEKAPGVVLEILGPHLLDPDTWWGFAAQRDDAFVNAFPVDMLKQWIQDNGVPAARAIAPHMLSPYLDGSTAIVPPLTEFILEKFESDESVFSAFCSAGHDGRFYHGDIAGQHEKEAEVAEKFQTHRLRRIREWADYEVRRGRADAQEWREHEEQVFET